MLKKLENTSVVLQSVNNATLVNYLTAFLTVTSYLIGSPVDSKNERLPVIWFMIGGACKRSSVKSKSLESFRFFYQPVNLLNRWSRFEKRLDVLPMWRRLRIIMILTSPEIEVCRQYF